MCPFSKLANSTISLHAHTHTVVLQSTQKYLVNTFSSFFKLFTRKQTFFESETKRLLRHFSINIMYFQILFSSRHFYATASKVLWAFYGPLQWGKGQVWQLQYSVQQNNVVASQQYINTYLCSTIINCCLGMSTFHFFWERTFRFFVVTQKKN